MRSQEISTSLLDAMRGVTAASVALLRAYPDIRTSDEWQALKTQIMAACTEARNITDQIGEGITEYIDEDQAREMVREARESMWKGGR